ncbi:hypothetical protein L6R50_17335 [Myxococcota bacterium]|nr:hypothetical protein [Myxococcota bacterium]
MRTSILTPFAAAALALALAARPAPLAAGTPESGEASAAPAGKYPRERLLERVEVVRTQAILRALDLEAPQAEGLFPVLNAFSERRKVLTEERWVLNREVAAALRGEPPDPARLAGIMDRVVANKRATLDVEIGEYDALKRQLDPVRLARYYDASVRFEKHMRKLIGEVKVKGGKPGGGDGAGRPGRPRPAGAGRQEAAPGSGGPAPTPGE